MPRSEVYIAWVYLCTMLIYNGINYRNMKTKESKDMFDWDLKNLEVMLSLKPFPKPFLQCATVHYPN